MGKCDVPNDTTPLVNETALDRNGSREDKAEMMSLWKDSGTRRKLLLPFIFSGQLIVFLVVSSPFPFMTKLILDRGGTALESSIILQITLLTSSISSIVFGKYQIYISSKVLLLTGLICYTVCQIAFGFLDYVRDLTTFVVVAIIIRSLQGIGLGGYTVAALTILCQEFTDYVGIVFGVSESLIAVGYICGPLLGGLLYSVAENLLLPFVVLGGLVLPLVPMGYILLQDAKKRTEDSYKFSDVIRKPESAFLIGAVVVTAGGFGLLEVIGSVYMLSTGLTVVEVGSGLLITGGTYCISSVAYGYIVGKGSRIRRVLFFLSLIAFIAGQFIFSPGQSMTGIFVGMALGGIFSGGILICAFSELIHITVGGDDELKSNFAMHSALSGVWILALGVGEFVLPLVGSQLYGKTEYRYLTSGLMAAGTLLAMVFAFVMFLLQRMKNLS